MGLGIGREGNKLIRHKGTKERGDQGLGCKAIRHRVRGHQGKNAWTQYGGWEIGLVMVAGLQEIDPIVTYQIDNSVLLGYSTGPHTWR